MVDNTTTPKTPEQVAADNKKMYEADLSASGEFLAAINKGAATTLSIVGSIGEGMMKLMGEAAESIGGNSAQLSLLTKTYSAFRMVTQTQDVFTGINKGAESFGTINNQIKSMGVDWQNLTNIIPGLGKALTASLENAGKGEEMQASMVSMLSSAGNLNMVFNDQGGIVNDLTNQTLKYADSLGTVAEANGLTLSTTAQYANSLYSALPGAMNENIEVGGKLNTTMSGLTTALKVMSGSGQSNSVMMEVMKTAYQNVGNDMGKVNNQVEKGITLFSMMSVLSKDLKITFAESSKFLGDLAQSFKFVGDNTQAAANILLKYTDGLRNTGLTSSASMEIIKGMTDSMATLTTGSKAFISARNGGPGGLQGSVQIDKLEREGKTDQVMQMVMNAMKQQFGGRIITQAEGAQSQEGAAQFTKQKMLLQSGAFGNLVGSGPDADKKATRLLESLASGNLGQAAKDSKQVVGQVASQGNSLQEKTNTILNKMALTSERTAIATQTTALRLLRGGGGAEGIQAGKLAADMKVATHSSGLVDRDITRETSGNDNDKKLNYDKLQKQMETGLIESLSGVKSLGSEVVSKGAEGLKAASQQLTEMSKKKAEDDKQKKIVKNTPILQRPISFTPDQTKQLTIGANQTARQTAFRANTQTLAANNKGTNHEITINLKPGVGVPVASETIKVSIPTNNIANSNASSITGEPGSNSPNKYDAGY